MLKNCEKGPTNTKKGHTIHKIKEINPKKFFLLCMYFENMPRAYESLNPGLLVGTSYL